MKRKTFYICIAIITFLIGIIFTSLLLLNPTFTTSKPNDVIAACPFTDSPTEIADESYAIYSALLNRIKYSPENGSKVISFVINENTCIDRVSEIIHKKSLQDLNLDILSDFKASLEDYKTKNKESQKLTRSFDLKGDYSLISQNEFEKTIKGNNLVKGWEAFYKKHPDSAGFITFSKVGFDTEKKYALVYLELSCGSLCADGSYFLLTKESDEWKVTKQITMWVS